MARWGPKDLKGFSGSSATVTDTGVYSWLWGRVTNFVADRGMHVKIDLEVSEASSSAANVLSSNIRRSKDFVDVAEGREQQLEHSHVFCAANSSKVSTAVNG